jgi:dimethylhistidine N-methyltransferase
MSVSSATSLLAGQPQIQEFRRDVLVGLSQHPKRLPCKHFYDRRGSMLFEAICAQPEYYLTRTEQRIMHQHSGEMAAVLGEHVTLIEFGSGSSAKTRQLLAHLPRGTTYVPIDISREHLLSSAALLNREFSALNIQPLCADFTALASEFALPTIQSTASRRVVYFPGSTIGNFEPTDAVRLLSRIGRLCGDGGGLLIGIDLVKEAAILERAYNDAAGVTAEFNLNLLIRINRELYADFDLDQFEHLASYDPRFERVEMRLASKRPQQVRISGRQFYFDAGEAIHTEYSHKYRVDRFARLSSESGWKLSRWWTDENQHFAVLYLECVPPISRAQHGHRPAKPR